MVRSLRLLNAIEAGYVSGPQLETMLTGSQSLLGDFSAVVSTDGYAKRLLTNQAAVDVISASSAARLAVANSRVALLTMADSPAGRLTMWNSDLWMASIQSSNAAVETLMSAPTAVFKSIATTNVYLEAVGVKLITLRRWYSVGGEFDYLSSLRTGEQLPGYNARAIKYGPTYNNLGNDPLSDDNTGNMVRSCSSLRRLNTALSPIPTLNISYLLV